MLPHWFKRFQLDELQIFIHPAYLELTRNRRHWRDYFVPKQVAKATIDIKSANYNPHKMQWDGLLNTLNDTLKLPEWQNASVTIVLSDHFVRYTTISNHQSLSSPAEQQAYVMHCFNLAFGEQLSAWNVQVSHAGFEKASLASAIPQDFLQTLLDILRAQQLKVKAVYPQLMFTANDSIKTFQKSIAKNVERSFWLAVIQDDRLCVALIENGHWLAVSNVIAELDVYLQLQAIISRTSIHHNVGRHHPILLNWLVSMPYHINRISGFQVVHVSEAIEPQTGESRPTHLAELEAA